MTLHTLFLELDKLSEKGRFPFETGMAGFINEMWTKFGRLVYVSFTAETQT
jgi:hypothetical protein